MKYILAQQDFKHLTSYVHVLVEISLKYQEEVPLIPH